MTTTTERQEPPADEVCGALKYAEDGSGRVASCARRKGHGGWHEGEVTDEHDQPDGWETWRD